MKIVGSFYDNNQGNKYGYIHGIDKSTAVTMTPDISVLCNDHDNSSVTVPKIADILAVSTGTEIDALAISSTVTFKARNFIPILPFLIDPINEGIKSSNGDAKEVMLKVVAAIKEFDTTHASDSTYTEKAKSKCKDLLFWLYLVASDNAKVNPVPFNSCLNKKVVKAIASVAEDYLTTVSTVAASSSTVSSEIENSLKRPFEILAATTSSTSKFMEKIAQIQSANVEKSNKSFKKIPSKYQNMILVASSVGEVTELDYSAEATEFFKCLSALHAQVLLNSQFEAEGVEISVSSAVVSSLMFGNFLWKDSLSPSGFASSVLTSEGIVRVNTLHEGMVLDLSTRFDISSKSMDKLTKTQVIFPKDVEELIHCLQGIHILSKFFFKKSIFLTQGLCRLVSFCVENKMLLRTKVFLDKRFIAKLLCAVDERIYLWLKQCGQSDSVMDTDLTIVNFSTLTQDFTLNRFQYFLPPSVMEIVNGNNDEDKENLQRKSKKKKESQQSERVKNEEMRNDWKLKDSKNWDSTFKNKNVEGPMLSFGCKPCLKYHVKGVCYTDCKYKEAHRNITNTDDAEKTSKFISGLRKE